VESQGGVIRTDTSRVRVWFRNGGRSRQEAGRTPADGARSDRQCVAQAAQEDGASALEDESSGRLHRHSSGSGPESAAQTAAHSTAHLEADSGGVARLPGRRTDRSPVCPRPKTCAGAAGTGDVRTAELCLGVEAQVDWYEAYADVCGERTKLQVFAMRSMASGAAFHHAYRHATQQAFLEAHELAFAYFGGVFRRLRYDNLTSAVRKILRGSRREETARFIAFRSHWKFEAEFCTPSEPHEKGGIEGEAGYFRRNHWVPVPEAAEVEDLNQQLFTACQQGEHRVIAGREQTVGANVLVEREHLLPLAEEGLDLALTMFPTINGLGCVKVLTNAYSVPLPAGTQVQAKVYAGTVELWHEGRWVARHERSSIWSTIWMYCFASQVH